MQTKVPFARWAMWMLSTLLGLSAMPALAGLTIYPMTVVVGGNNNAPGRILVTSTSDQTQYIKVIVKRIVEPATDREAEQDVTSWDGESLVVSPMKFALPAGSSRSVRVISMRAQDQEGAYRVYFEGVAAPTDDPAITSSAGIGTEVKVNLVWGVLVRLRPKQSVPRLERRQGELLNTGNARIGVVAAGSCKTTEDASCAWHDINRSVYPGSGYLLPKDLATSPVRVKYQIDGTDTLQIQDFSAYG